LTSQKYNVIGPGCVLVDHGPVHMTISAWSGDDPAPSAAEIGAEKAIRLLEVLSRHLTTARQPVGALKPEKDVSEPEVLVRMIAAVAELDQESFTPMAAVAGTFSDLVKEQVLQAGADRVIVNNGGDIALSVGSRNKAIRVGIVSELSQAAVTHTIDIGPGTGLLSVEGVATSGFGGRSLTKGLASAVVCFAKNSSFADAAATSVANATNCEDSGVKRCPAEILDPLTDLKGQTITCEVGDLSKKAVTSALKNGLQNAKALYEKKMIAGAIIFIKGRIETVPEALLNSLQPLAQSNDNGS
jgi:ApbE superfamily uncharacterized protein (UPF0280 family)